MFNYFQGFRYNPENDTNKGSKAVSISPKGIKTLLKRIKELNDSERKDASNVTDTSINNSTKIMTTQENNANSLVQASNVTKSSKTSEHEFNPFLAKR